MLPPESTSDSTPPSDSPADNSREHAHTNKDHRSAKSTGGWLHLFLILPACGALMVLGAAGWETRKKFRVLEFLASDDSPGLSVVGQSQFRETFEFGSLYAGMIGYFAGGAVLALFLSFRLSRLNPSASLLAIASRLTRSYHLAWFSLLLPLSFVVGLHAPNWSAGFNDYRTLWQLAQLLILGLILRGVAISYLELKYKYSDETTAPPTAALMPSRGLAFWVAAGCCLLYALTFTTMTWQRHLSLHSATHDLGLYDQALWNMVHGNGQRVTTWMFVTPSGHYNGLENFGYSYAAEHFMPVLFLLAPIYALFQTPLTLLFLQSFALGGAGWLLFLLTRRLTRSDFLSLAIAVSFLLHPSLQEANLKDFHADTFEPLFAFLAFFAWTKRQPLLYAFGLAMFLLCKEDAALMGFGFGLFLLTLRDWKYGGITAGGCLLYFFGVGQIIEQTVREGAQLRHLWRYQHLAFPGFTDHEILTGAQPQGIGDLIKGVIISPWSALNPQDRMAELGGVYAPIISHERVRSLLLLGAPVLFCFLKSPRTLILLGIPYAAAFLSNWDHNFRLRMHYGIASLTWTYAAAVWALQHPSFRSEQGEKPEPGDDGALEDIASEKGEADEAASSADCRQYRHRCIGWGLGMLLVAIMACYYYGRVPFAKGFDRTTYLASESVEVFREAQKRISPGDSVSAANRLGPHLTDRPNLMLFPEVTHAVFSDDDPTSPIAAQPVDWIVLNTLDPPWPMSAERYRYEVLTLLDNPDYGLDDLLYSKGILLLKRGADSACNEKLKGQLEFAVY